MAFPDMVSTDARGYKQVNYAELPYLMLQAIRELKQDNDQLRQQVRELAGRPSVQAGDGISQLRREVEELRAMLAQLAAERSPVK
jgi:FtsZ-binding cell division protein ZapB